MNHAGPTAGLAAKHNEATALVARMTLEEKAAFGSGRSFWQLQGCERLGLAPVMVTDGPHGLRKQGGASDHVGLHDSVPATCFPTACALAASWDPDLLTEIGVALGEQCVAEDVTVLLGPGMNIKRHPLCGRNFEYFSEDPLLSGELAAAMIQGVQSQGVGTSIKHYAVNNQEYRRMVVDAIVDERTLREIYLRGFEIAVRKAQPWTVMCAYNRVNGTYCGEHDWLLNTVLRDEWGFEGLVVTDWGATNDRVRSIPAGLDLEMPDSGGINTERLIDAVRNGDLPEADLDRAIVRNVSLSLCGAEMAERNVALDQDAHHTLARRAAAESAVLLKNEDQALPLQPTSSLAVIGAFAQQPRYQGAGSSQVTPTRLDTAYAAIETLLDDPQQLRYAPGYDPVDSRPDQALVDEAVAAAQAADVALVFAGLPGIYESEGFDRNHMGLPEQHDRLIEAVCAANPNTVVVLANGAPVLMPWVDQPRAILEGYLGGQAGGAAIADLLFGRANPSGKLAETFPLAQQDVAADQWFPGDGRQVQYREGLYVGYRYFDSAGQPVLFPFGHGLSYTRFDYANMAVEERDGRWEVAFDLTNSGSVAGAEVVQLYVHDESSQVYRPEQELRAFTKVALAPGETRRVQLQLEQDAFAYYDVDAAAWLVEAGAFELRLGASSRDVRLRDVVQVASAAQPSAAAMQPGPSVADGRLSVPDATFAGMLGRPVPAAEAPRPFHVNSTLDEIGKTPLGAKLQAMAVKRFREQMGVETRDPTIAKMFDEMANSMPLRAMALFSRGKIGFRAIQALVAVLNHRYVKGLKTILGGRVTW